MYDDIYFLKKIIIINYVTVYLGLITLITIFLISE